MLAPTLVHQIWMQGWAQRPPKFEDNLQGLRRLNPEFEFKTWDEEQIALECARLGPEFAEKYRSFPHMISRVDYGRYVLLYMYGGISLDLDMKPLKPLRDTPGLDQYDFIVSASAFPFDSMGLVNNAVIIVKPKHPLLLEFLQRITDLEASEANFMNLDLYIHYTTGPFVFTEFVNTHRQEIHVMPHTFYEPCISADPYCKVSPDTIMDHQHELSWMTGFTKWLMGVLYFFLYYWRWVVGIGVVVGSIGIFMYFRFFGIVNKK